MGPPDQRRSLLGRVVTHIGVAFVAVELAVLAICTLSLWNSLVAERQDHLLRYAAAVRPQVQEALVEGPATEEGALDQELDAALSGGAERAPRRTPSRFIPPTGAPVHVWVFRGSGAQRFTRDGRLLPADAPEGTWTGPWPDSVRDLLGAGKLAAPVVADFQQVVRLEPIGGEAGGSPRAVLYLESSLRDLNRDVALFSLLAFLAGGLALIAAATVTMGFLRKSLLLPLSRIIEADNAARRGDTARALVDAGDIPDDEVGAIMRSRNHLFEAMTSAQQDLDEKNVQLQEQREELRVWGRELERLVQDKTAALLRAREVLHRTEKLAALGRLAANVAHEINNPLACIAGYAEAAQADLAGNGDEETLRSLKTIEEQAFRCKDILKRLLGLARTDEPRLEQVDLGDLIRETVALSEHTRSKRSVELRLTLDGSGPTLRSDPGSLQQVVLNLVENAIDAAAVGRPPAWIEVSLQDGGGEVGIAVRDSGRGIPTEARSRVFDPFYTTKPVGRGTGLGLAICQSLVERLGGRIALADADDGAGATFVVWLPREPSPAAPSRPLEATPGTTTADASDLVEAQVRVASGAADPEATP